MAKAPLYLIDEAVQTRFLARVPSDLSASECWEWQGPIGKKGYGIFNFLRNNFRAHRMALYLSTGEMPDELYALHSCDNPPCCNPHHLRWGTHQENQQDKIDRGRVRGERNNRAKITAVDAEFIRNTDRTTVQLMEWFGLGKAQINRIRRNVSW